jgi:Protein of unknown function (DUF2786)
MSNIDSNILEKLKKLISLAENNTNEHEATLAMERAIEWSMKHNIDLHSFKEKQFNKIDDVIKMDFMGNDKRRPFNHPYISVILTSYFNVNLYMYGSRKAGRKIMFVGTHDNIEFAKYLYNFLNTTFTNLWYNYKKKNNLDVKKYKLSYVQGMSYGLCKKLDETKKRVIDENNVGDSYTLMVVDQIKKRNDFVMQTFGKVRTTGGNHNADDFDLETLSDGIDEGKQIEIYSGIESGESNEKCALQG